VTAGRKESDPNVWQRPHSWAAGWPDPPTGSSRIAASHPDWHVCPHSLLSKGTHDDIVNGARGSGRRLLLGACRI